MSSLCGAFKALSRLPLRDPGIVSVRPYKNTLSYYFRLYTGVNWFVNCFFQIIKKQKKGMKMLSEQ